MILVWQIMDDSPNSPNFPPAKLSRYMVISFSKYAIKWCQKVSVGIGHCSVSYNYIQTIIAKISTDTNTGIDISVSQMGMNECITVNI